MRYLFYIYKKLNDLSNNKTYINSHYEVKLWRPTISKLLPPGCPIYPFAVWWLFHQLRIFSNREYSVLIIIKDNKLVHRSCVFPKYFRFPFMAKVDMQIGNTWTSPDHRGKGLASFAIAEIILAFRSSSRYLWYLAEEKNKSSIRVAENAGFILAGLGERTQPGHIRLFGSFIMNRNIKHEMRENV